MKLFDDSFCPFDIVVTGEKARLIAKHCAQAQKLTLN